MNYTGAIITSKQQTNIETGSQNLNNDATEKDHKPELFCPVQRTSSIMRLLETEAVDVLMSIGKSPEEE